jgi:hypothetical protein
METELKETYECPTMDVVELNTETPLLAASIPDYIPEAW